MKQVTDRQTGLGVVLVLLASLALTAAHAATITGTVKNEAGAGLGNVDIDFIDLCTGDSVFIASDKTAADGSFSVVVANGTYDIHYTPPTGSVVAAGDRQDYVVSGNANLGITTLHPGRLVSGTVKNSSGVGVANVDLKWVDQATDHRVFMGKDVTNASGQYSIRVLPGTWDVDYRPPATTTFTDAERIGLVVGASDISGLIDTLGTGFAVTGTVQEKRGGGAKVKNVDIDAFDQCTGKRIATSHDNSDVNGLFTIYLPPGTYTLNYDPPRCKPLEAARFPGTVVDRNTTMNTAKLADAVLVTGVVLDDLGAPLPDAKLKFFDATAAGTPRQATTNDRTDATGAFSVYVPTSTFDIQIEPPVGKLDQTRVLTGVVVAAATNIGNVQLVAGSPVNVHVVGPSNQPVLNVDINAVDSLTRVAQPLAHDNTDAAGNGTVVMAAGTYDMQYDPPACSGFAPASQNGRVVSGSTTLPTLSLVVGVHALGSVFDTHALPINNVDLDFYPAGQAVKSYTPRDSTALDGSYDTTIQPGSYDINYIPPSGTRYRPARLTNVTMLTNTTIPTVFLADGWLVSGLVKSDATLLPIAGVTVDFYAPGASTPLWTNHHVTIANGSYNIAVDAGTWDILYTPPAGSGLAPRWRRGVAISLDTPLPDTLLLALTIPTVTSITPAAGSTAGGLSVTVVGTGFQPDAIVKIGGVTAKNIVVVSSTTITATTPAHPAGKVDLTVVNPGDQIGTKTQAFTFNEAAIPVRLTVQKSGGNVVLSWLSTAQPNYSVFRNGQPTGFSDASILTTTTSLNYTDTSSSSVAGSVTFYQVD
ncbi:MAG: IPT/TIG domain-containing protein [Acidobacteriota bacterium]